GGQGAQAGVTADDAPWVDLLLGGVQRRQPTGGRDRDRLLLHRLVSPGWIHWGAFETAGAPATCAAVLRSAPPRLMTYAANSFTRVSPNRSSCAGICAWRPFEIVSRTVATAPPF